MFQSVAFLPEGDDAEMSVFCGQVGFLAFLHERLFLQSVGDDVLDLYQPDSQLLGFFHQFRHSCHRAVGIEDFDERRGGTESCQPGQVDGSLGVSCPAQHAVVLGIERVDVSRATEGLRSGSRVGQCLDGGSTVMGGHTGGATFQLVDGHGEGGAKHRRVFLHLMRQFQLAGTAGGDRCAKHATPFFQHEIHFLRCDGLSSCDEVSFVLAVFIIHDNNEFALTEVVNGLFYRSKYIFIH